MNQKLQEAIALFSDESKRLSRAYAELQEEFFLLRAKEDLSFILSHLSEGLLLVSCEGVITYLNHVASQLLGVEDLKVPYEALFEDTLLGFSMKEALHSKKCKREILLHWKEEKHIEVTATYISEKGVLCILRDVTDVQRLRRASEQNERLQQLGEMAASLAHEIRNPLGGIQGFATLLQRDLMELPQQLEMVKKIIEGTEILGRLVTNILDYARPCPVHFEVLNVSTLMEETLEYMISKKCSFILDKEKADLKVLADKDLLRLSLLNLLKNSEEAAVKQVALKLKKQADAVIIEIQDDGEGIAPKHRDLIFTPFFTTKKTGTGLGLSEVHKMITAMGGKITFESALSQGTTFKVELPRV